jgi:signal transduction histidine kinase
VTHELRTPLTTFRLYTDLLARGAVPADETPEYLDTLDREAGRLDHLVDNVLAFSGLERRPVRSATVPLGALLEEHVPELVERAERKGFVLQVATAPEHADVPVRAETTSVGRILANLVDNATKYAADAKPRELLLDTAVRRRHVVLALRDHGPGIDPAERRRIFRPFHRSAGQAAGSAPGVGLGLALARRLARSMGGDLQLTSADHDGARFELTLRRARCRPEDSPERSHDPQETTP